MNTEKLVQTFYQIGAVQLGEFKLKSGEISNIYINLRKIISYPALLRDIAEMMYQASDRTHYNLVCGVPYTALPIATCLSTTHDVPMIMRRKEKKDYGTKQTIEGIFQPGQTVLIIEDVITTGGSVLETTQELEAQGLIIHDVIAVIDREQGGRNHLEKKYRLKTLLTLTQLLTILIHATYISANDKQLLETIIQARA